MRTSPLDAAHRDLGAKMGAFGGWDMPISYTGTLKEHEAVRTTVGLFDVSHLGKILVSGTGARGFLDSTVTNRMADLPTGRSRYTLLCDEQGGIIDDLICYALDDDRVLTVPNAGNRDAVEAVFAALAPPSVVLDTLDWTTIAIQGPASKRIVEARWPATKGMPYTGVVSDGTVVIARTGYTGEWGYEIFTPASAGLAMWDALLAEVRAAGGEPCGLAARDTLRLEMGYPLHGNDISLETTPLEAGLGWAVKADGRSFPGADAISAAPPTRLLRGLRAIDRLIPRAGCEVYADGTRIGTCTSGTMSPTEKVGIALAYLDAAFGGEEVEVEVRGKRGRFSVVRPPFVDRSPKRDPEV